jgi:hypothetical protein
MENIMKLSEDTLSIIKNFSAINRSILFRPGNVLRTISPTKSVFARATVSENFPVQCAIYEVPRFLGACSLFDNPELDFGDKQMRITDGKRSVDYTYADPNAIIAPPEKDINLPSRDVEFRLSGQDFQNIVRAANVLSLKNIVVLGSDGKTNISARDVKNPSTDSYTIDVGQTDKEFSIVFNVENLVKLLVRDYNVTICAKGISCFEADDVTYFVALETTSEYKG